MVPRPVGEQHGGGRRGDLLRGRAIRRNVERWNQMNVLPRQPERLAAGRGARRERRSAGREPLRPRRPAREMSGWAGRLGLHLQNSPLVGSAREMMSLLPPAHRYNAHAEPLREGVLTEPPIRPQPADSATPIGGIFLMGARSHGNPFQMISTLDCDIDSTPFKPTEMRREVTS